MLKKFIIGLMLVTGFEAFGFALKVSIMPARPIVIVVNADPGNGTVLEAPWFQGSMTIQNPSTEVVTITGIAAQMKLSWIPLQSRLITFEQPIEIEPGGSYTYQLYISGLKKGWGYDYHTIVQALGWIGPKDSQGPRFEDSLVKFITR